MCLETEIGLPKNLVVARFVYSTNTSNLKKGMPRNGLKETARNSCHGSIQCYILVVVLDHFNEKLQQPELMTYS